MSILKIMAVTLPNAKELRRMAEEGTIKNEKWEK